jgi:hypothetical protein
MARRKLSPKDWAGPMALDRGIYVILCRSPHVNFAEAQL